jgi:hypothetical protein
VPSGTQPTAEVGADADHNHERRIDGAVLVGRWLAVRQVVVARLSVLQRAHRGCFRLADFLSRPMADENGLALPDESARTDASGFIWCTSGTTTPAAPTAAIEIPKMWMKSRRVGSSPAACPATLAPWESLVALISLPRPVGEIAGEIAGGLSHAL